MRQLSILLAFFLLSNLNIYSQKKVGVVLSGGGASGLAHIGVLKALEENNIPIDYIVGTSIGALVGGLYASGYSPNEIETLITSEEFLLAANGKIKEDFIFYLKENTPNPGLITWNFNLDSLFESNIPTNFISSVPIDFGLMQYFAPADSKAQQNFDSLFIPFRCLASDITNKSLAVFNKGNLASCIRASMTYPFFIAPITIDGNVMFDGGLYNNFPVDILCDEFQVDFIIASDVTSELEAPTEDNLVSQIRNMLIKAPQYELICQNGIIINSKVDDISTFEFEDGSNIISRGYVSTMNQLDSIKKGIGFERKQKIVSNRRDSFNNSKPELYFDQIKINGLHHVQEKYISREIDKDRDGYNMIDLEKPYMKLASDPKIKTIYPSYEYDSISKKFNLDLEVKKQKQFKVTFGGVFSSKPISTGFLELDYQNLGATGIKASGNIFFGNFYSSAQAKMRWEIPFNVPFYIEANYTINQFDYFNSRSTFVEEEDPPYIISTERFGEVNIGIPITNKSKFVLGTNYTWKNFEYYQSNNFNRGDTSDLSFYEGTSFYGRFDFNSLNHRMFASKGVNLNLMLRYIDGIEETTPGSTSNDQNFYKKNHNWWIFRGVLEKYFFQKNSFRIGGLIDGVVSNQPFFQNYTATVLNLTQFQPLPENATLFQPRYRALSYIGGGLKTIYTFNDKLDFRLEGYIFQPYEALVSDLNGKAKLLEEGIDRSFIGTFTTVYRTRVGPLAASINYFDDEENEFSFLIHFGYILFNRKAYE